VVKEESDARAIKTLLALQSQAKDRDDLHVVVEVFDPDLRALVRRIAGPGVVALDARDILSRILVQTSRSLGLSVVYDELLSFEGNEVYFFDGPFDGLTFGESIFRCPQAIPIGVRTPNGEIEINPDPDRVLTREDRLLLVAEDDSTIDFRDRPVVEPTLSAVEGHRLEQARERYLIVGDTPKSPIILTELAGYVLPGSEVHIIPRKHRQGIDGVQALAGEVDGLRVDTLDLDPLSPATWTAVSPWSYDSIVILSEGNEMASPDQIDAETILILLLIRRALESHGAEDTTVITELVESENQVLAASTGVHDFVISSRLVSMLMAQISEQPGMNGLYERLFEEEGSEVYLKPVSLYLDALPTEIAFGDLIGLAMARREICLGVKVAADEHRADRNYGIRLAPLKTAELVIAPEDQLVVLAEDDT
jgi:hypothetical protein